MRNVLLAFAGLMLALPATALAQDDYKAAIEASTAKFEAVYNAGDAAALAALYTEDAVIIPPNMDPIAGNEAIQAFWAEAMTGGVTFELKTKEVIGGGDLLVEVGSYVGTAADGSHADHGVFMVAHKNVDGEWKLHRDIWNSSMK